MDRDPDCEVLRAPELTERVDVESVDRVVDVEEPAGLSPSTPALVRVGVAAPCRGVQRVRELAVHEDHHEIVMEVHLDQVPASRSRRGDHTIRDGYGRRPGDGPAAGQVGSLLQGPDRLLGGIAEIAVRST